MPAASQTDADLPVSLDAFVAGESRRIALFRQWWLAMNKVDPENFPLEIAADNAGLWIEALEFFDPNDPVTAGEMAAAGCVQP